MGGRTVTGGQLPRIERLRVHNFRALQEFELAHLTPLTALVGPNGSGKSTVLDVFAFLAEAFESGLRRAWDRRGKARELRTRGAEGPVKIEIRYRERPRTPPITYHLAVDERDGAPVVAHESLRWRRGGRGRPFHFLQYQNGDGRAASGEAPDAGDTRIPIPLKSPDLLAVNALGQFREHPRVAALRDFILGWQMLAHLILLRDPDPPPLIGIEAPENSLHPRLLHRLAEECRGATDATQLLVTTHSPFFVNALHPRELRVLWRGEDGYTRCEPLNGNERIASFVKNGAQLGDLWMEGHFGVGDPLTRGGMASAAPGAS